MTLPMYNSGERGYTPTQPFDASDPVRFGQLIETAKDAFKQEFTRFFTLARLNTSSKVVDIPTIEKYAINGGSNSASGLETTVNLIMSYADTPDRLPMIAITSASARERRLGLGGNQVGTVQYTPSLLSANQGLYSLKEGDYLVIKTWPEGAATRSGSDITQSSTVEFVDSLFENINQATLIEVVNAINLQGLYYRASVSQDGYLRLEPGGPLAKGEGRYIEIEGGSSTCLAALGYTVGQSDIYTSSDNLPKHRYFMSADMTINLDVISDDLNTKQELADLIYTFFTYYLEQRYFQLLGRSYFERGLDPEEWYHLILNGQFSWSGETSVPRPGQEGYDRIYSVRGSVPITLIDYIDKRVVSGFSDQVVIEPGDALPRGDYGGEDAVQVSGKLQI